MANQNATVLEALSLAVAARVPVLLWGPPGAGKSSAVEDMCRSIDLTFEVVIASIREPSDFSGLPVITENGVEFAPPRWAKTLAEAGNGLLFLDEISTAPPAVQAALLRVVLERVVGDLALPDDSLQYHAQQCRLHSRRSRRNFIQEKPSISSLR